MQPEQFMEGNLRDETLREIWLMDGSFSYNRMALHANTQNRRR